MKMKHLLIEGYCDGLKGQKNNICGNTFKIGVDCLECSHFSYSICPNEIAISDNEGVIVDQGDFIGFGGDMEPKDLDKRDNCIGVWKNICRKKINEAYDEYKGFASL